MTIEEVLGKLREAASTERGKGAQFERLMQRWLGTDPRFAQRFEQVWLWSEFPFRADISATDVGIDLVAKTHEGEFWAVQCKCYEKTAVIDKPAVDSFVTTASKLFRDEAGESRRFAHLLWISTTNHWNKNAEEAIQNLAIPLSRINLNDLDKSPVVWEELLLGKQGKEALRPGKQLMEHQLEAIRSAKEHYKDHDRGKLIMACGTGKTFTSLRLAEELLGGQGLVLFMVPSIALLSQALNDWFADSKVPLRAVCVCSDNKASGLTERGKKRGDDEYFGSLVDLPEAASTNVESVVERLKKFKEWQGLTVVFSTYQSVDVVGEAQKKLLESSDGTYGVFDLIICDEAHRTTGVEYEGKPAEGKAADKSGPGDFQKIHKGELVRGRKRLYMTATPRIYGDSAKDKAKERNGILYSMDDEAVYGKEFYRVNFDYAVQHGILTDYKVLVLTITESEVPPELRQRVQDGSLKELNYDDACKLVGVINALSKRLKGDDGKTFAADPRLMKRALAYTFKIGSAGEPGTSKNVAATFPMLSADYAKTLGEEAKKQTVHLAVRHVDGSMHAPERNEALSWLAEEPEDEQECRIITNVRCLSEGVDVPALDAVIFLSARNSQVDVVQSVGRVMRSFHKGQSDEKKYGYIVIPVVIPESVRPEEALDDNKAYAVVWAILNALRAHDDHFNAIVNSVQLNKERSGKIILARPGLDSFKFGTQVSEEHEDYDAGSDTLSAEEIARQLNLRFGKLQTAIYAKLVEKCGDRFYWETWAAEVGDIAKKFIERIERLVKEGGDFKLKFDTFVNSLRENLNPGLGTADCIEMLAQHMITRPVFDVLFKDYAFISNNSVSSSMQRMLDTLVSEGFEKDLGELRKFYDSVKVNIGQIDNLAGKQTIIKTLYEKFFKGAFPTITEKLGIVYTPVECVDFIIRSVDDILREDFGTALTNADVNILDPFTGTGTFITRLLQTGVIRPEDMKRKYLHEIHANELNMLAYYVADVNIESVFQEVCPQSEYLDYDGICLTDTFQLYETGEGELKFPEYLKENSEAVRRQKRAPIQVIIGNPPYSVGQKSANDNAQNDHYPKLEERIASTYAKLSTATNKNSLYDSYIKAFRWASDRIDKERGGVIAFISNGSWLDGNAHDGMRATLVKEFDKIYVFNLRGNQRTSGELSRREGGKIFGSGSRAPIAITLLVKLAGSAEPKGQIFYHDIGDYLSREQKLGRITEARSVNGLEWERITPTAKHDWINQRGGEFDTLIPLGDKDNKANKQTFFEPVYSRGIATSRDAWAYNSSKKIMLESMKRSDEFYNAQRLEYNEAVKSNPNLTVEQFINVDETKISWSRAYRNDIKRNKEHVFDADKAAIALYRPFFKQNLYFDRAVLNDVGPISDMFPTAEHKNLVICVSGVGVTKEFSCIITDCIPDLQVNFNGQCFPLYWYVQNEARQGSLFSDGAGYTVREGVTDWIVREARARYGKSDLRKESVFYYVYGLLHSPDYRKRFSNDLKKSLPRLPLVEGYEAFQAFEQAGRSLAALHLHYDEHLAEAEAKAAELGVKVVTHGAPAYTVQKMRFGAAGKASIELNPTLEVTGIPAKAYEYVVNGKSAIEWLMERYAVTTDKKSGIRNDPNLWAEEHGEPRYILDVLLSVIALSVETQQIVEALPALGAKEEAKAQKPQKVKRPQTPQGKPPVTRPITPVSSLQGLSQAPCGELRLTIKEVPFYQIIKGWKTIERRELKPTTETKFALFECEGELYKKYEDVPAGSSEVRIVPKAYKTLRLDAGAYAKDRDYAILEIEDIGFDFLYDEDGEGNLVRRTAKLPNGRNFPNCIMAIKLGKILESKVTKEIVEKEEEEG